MRSGYSSGYFRLFAWSGMLLSVAGFPGEIGCQASKTVAAVGRGGPAGFTKNCRPSRRLGSWTNGMRGNKYSRNKSKHWFTVRSRSADGSCRWRDRARPSHRCNGEICGGGSSVSAGSTRVELHEAELPKLSAKVDGSRTPGSVTGETAGVALLSPGNCRLDRGASRRVLDVAA